MNPATDNEHPQPAEPSATDRVGDGPLPSGWRDALLNLIASRSALIQIEMKEAAERGARSAVLVIAAILCAFFTWALLLAGGISAVACATDWPWHWLALGTAGIHLLAAIILANAAKASKGPAFPITRSEFQKDREWIESLQKTRKSNG